MFLYRTSVLSESNEQIDDAEHNDVVHDEEECLSVDGEETESDDERRAGGVELPIHLPQPQFVLQIGLGKEGWALRKFYDEGQNIPDGQDGDEAYNSQENEHKFSFGNIVEQDGTERGNEDGRALS